MKLKRPSKLKNSAGVKIKAFGKKVKNKTGEFKKKKHWVLITILSILILLSLSALIFTLYIILTSPDFDVNKLYKSSSTTILDVNGDAFAELGREKRDNITYDALPDVLVDAIVATEDSKFFQHSGIDLMRFGKAVGDQLLGRDDAGGGSTLTMQIVKNTYNGSAAHGIQGIIRKFKDIYMAVFKLEKTYTKQEIMEFYVNQAHLGGSSYGVEQAAQSYFGKSVGELNLSEAATIAGLFQAPSAYYPYAYPEKAEARRNRVLSLMVRHKYITQEEADVAKSIKMEDLLKKSTGGSIYKYQDFIDTVVADVTKRTGQNPYSVSMTIYTTMDPKRQEVVDKLYEGTIFSGGYKWKNDAVQAGVAITDVKDGSIVAIGARRNRTGVNQLNYATDIKRHPGSTAKPIFDYGPAFEYAGWGTGTTIVDDVYKYSTGQSINNVDRGYTGITTVKKALAQSRNIPALQAFQATTQDQKYEFVTNLGIKPEVIDGQILESASIGAFNGVSPLQMSAAYAAFARGGYYIEPYSFTKIVYNDTNETYNLTPTKTKVMSEETAYMINMILKYAVSSGNVKGASLSGTDIASKTGTSSVDGNKKKELGLSSSAIGDSWQCIYSPDYSISYWYGYDELTKEHYLTSNEGWNARYYIANALTSRIMKKGSTWSKPSGVVAVDVELETIPTMLASDYTPDELRSTEYFKKGTEPTEVSNRFSQLANPSNLTYTTVGNQITLSWNAIATPDAINSEYLQDYFNEGFKNWATKYYQNRLDWNTDHVGTLQYEIFIKNSNGNLTSLGMTTSTTFTTTLTNATSATYVVKSRYSIFGANASSGAEINVKITDIVVTPETKTDTTDTNTEQTTTPNSSENNTNSTSNPSEQNNTTE